MGMSNFAGESAMIPRRRLHNAMRILAVAGLAVGFAVTAVAADVVILKDGFVLQGTVRKETTSIHDPASGKIFPMIKGSGSTWLTMGRSS